MCGRIVTAVSPELLTAVFGLPSVPGLESRYNVAPTQQVGVIRQSDDSDHNRFDQMKWGLVPSWSKDTEIANHTLNARSETVAEKPSFRHAIKYNRCIIPTSGFYEWSHVGEKHPHYIHLTDWSLMGLACIWEHWKAPDETVLETFSILTTSANKLVSNLHDRMPVILHPDNYDLWLNRNMHDVHVLDSLYTPYPDEMLAYHKVPDLVNNPRFDSPACIVQI